MVCIKSGDTIDDVVDYVRREMYKALHEKKGDDSDEEGEEVEEKDDKHGSEGKTSQPNEKSNIDEQRTNSSIVAGDGNKNNDKSEGVIPEKNDVEENNISVNHDVGHNDDNDSLSSSSELSVDNMPSSYIFPSFFIFMLWGPFAAPENRLSITLISDNGKKGVSRKEQRSKDKEAKMIDLVNDTKNVRGFTTDQRIQIESLNLQKQDIVDRKKERSLVSCIAEESALGRQIESAERRAASRCPTYDANNVYWKRVDDLLMRQDKVINKIGNFIDQDDEPISTISPFLNEPSPEKPQSTNNAQGNDIPQSIGDSDSVTEMTSISTSSQNKNTVSRGSK